MRAVSNPLEGEVQLSICRPNQSVAWISHFKRKGSGKYRGEEDDVLPKDGAIFRLDQSTGHCMVEDLLVDTGGDLESLWISH